jgi:ribosomal protein S12 methylthiotransferase accessory factor
VGSTGADHRGTIEDDLRALLGALRSARLPQVLVLDLSRPGWPVHVARVLVPGAEGPCGTPAYTPGRRAQAAYAAHRAAPTAEAAP